MSTIFQIIRPISSKSILFKQFTLPLPHHLILGRSLSSYASTRRKYAFDDEGTLRDGYEENVIDIPAKMIRIQEKKQRIRAERLQKFQEKYGVDKRKAKLVIACKRRELNHYDGQIYPNDNIPLVSTPWKKSRFAGDYFVLNSIGKNPSLNWTDLRDQPQDFDNYNLSPEILRNIHKMGYKKPTLIQHYAIPECQLGRNTLIAAETGSGKTLAYAAPVLNKIMKRRRNSSGVRVLAITPGRELAHQTYEALKNISEDLDIKTELRCGQTPNSEFPLQEETDVLVATPGLLHRLVDSEKLSLDSVDHVIVDEADSLLDESFATDIINILNRIKLQVMSETGSRVPGAQLILSSATFPQDLDIILEGVIDPEDLTKITSNNLHHVLPHVPQRFIRVSDTSKIETITEIVNTAWREKQQTLVFARDMDSVDELYDFFSESSIPMGKLHGRMNPTERDETFKKFRNCEINVLIATDVASRGLDTKKVVHVVNYDFPRNLADYIHRIGRVGRVGSERSCKITNLVRRKYEVYLVQEIEESIRRETAIQNVNSNIKNVARERKQR